MCGICGYVGCNRPELIEPMCDAMVHRGPDDFGSWHDSVAGVGLGQRRLSIIDLSSAGHQPMTNSDQSLWITYNGEVYNFQEHRKQLIGKGYTFRSQCDTEVVLYLYEEYGIDFLKLLNGIFAIAIWDVKHRTLLLARDHAGIKPFYYWQDGEKLYFASEIKALLRIPEIPHQLNEHVVPWYLTFMWVPGDETMFKGIKKIEPGHYLLWKNGTISHKQWYSLDYTPDEKPNEREWVERVREVFVAATRRQMVSDAALGAFLSGGMDSSSIAACMRLSFPEREINCYTIVTDKEANEREGFEDDYYYAKIVANRHNLHLKTRIVDETVTSYLPKIIYHLDEPDADPAAILTYLICELARQDGVKVLLSGTGGDEVFFGYRSHAAYRLYQMLDWPPNVITSSISAMGVGLLNVLKGKQSAQVRRTEKFTRGLLNRGLARHIALVDWSSPKIRTRILNDKLFRSEIDFPSPPECMQRYFDSFIGSGKINRHTHLLINTFLAAHNFLYTDKATMAASIEARVPFLDTELLKLTAQIPEHHKFRGNTIKPLLGRAMKPYIPKEILDRKKTGFGVPVRSWISGGLSGMVEDCFASKRFRERGLYQVNEVDQILKENREGSADHAYLIYAMLSFELWQQTFIDQPGIELTT